MEQALEPSQVAPARPSRVSARAFPNLVSTRSEIAGLQREELLLESGHADAVETLGGMYLSGPRELFELFMELWGESGSALELHESGPLDGCARLVLVSAEAGDACWERIGFLERGLGLLGAKAVLVSEVECRRDGADACMYECEWSSHG